MNNWYLDFLAGEQEAAIPAAKEKHKEQSQKCKNLEAKIKDAKSFREKELKEAEAGVAKAKKKAEETNKAMKQKQQVGHNKLPKTAVPSLSEPSAPSLSKPFTPSLSKPSIPLLSKPYAALLSRPFTPSLSKPADPSLSIVLTLVLEAVKNCKLAFVKVFILSPFLLPFSRKWKP